jgi:uncharacterized protein YktB (UPF0637 family)
VVLSRVDLANHPTNAWPVAADDDKQVFRDKAHFQIRLDEFDVSKSLAICAYFVLALYDKNASIL